MENIFRKRCGENIGQIGKTILQQMGGIGRLKLMLGVQAFVNLPNGIGIKWPNQQRSRGNYVEIIYRPGPDLYDMIFYNLQGGRKKKVKEFKQVYWDDLVELFERQTGWHLRLGTDERLHLELAKLAHEVPEIRRHLVPILRKHGSAKWYSWEDGDPKAPRTPWGPAQTGVQLERGVWFYDTPGHGGFAIAEGAARKNLSYAAVRAGQRWGGYIWYEEDVDAIVPLFEVERWRKAAIRDLKIPASALSEEKMMRVLQIYFKKYLEERKKGIQPPEPLKAGDRLVFKKKVRFRDGVEVRPGDEVLVLKVARGNFIFRFGGGLYQLPKRYYENGDVAKI